MQERESESLADLLLMNYGQQDLILPRSRTVNIPWPQAGFGDGDYFYAFQEVVMPIGYEFAPDLVISMFCYLVQLLG